MAEYVPATNDGTGRWWAHAECGRPSIAEDGKHPGFCYGCFVRTRKAADWRPLFVLAATGD